MRIARKGARWGMNLQYYYHYIEIVEAGSFSGASRKLGVAQPALSNQVKALEERYETRLLQRGSGTHGLELTETGRILYEAAKKMRETEERAIREIGEMHGTQGDTLRLGVMNPPGNQYLLTPIHHYTERYPDAKVMVREAATLEELYRMLLTGIVEGIVANKPEQLPAETELVSQFSDEVGACYRKDVYFVGNENETVSLSELCKFPLCVTQADLQPFRVIFRAHDCTLLPKFVCTDYDACLRWARSGKAVALIQRRTITDGEGIGSKAIENGLLGGSEIAFIARKKPYRSRQLNRFTELWLELQETHFFKDISTKE